MVFQWILNYCILISRYYCIIGSVVISVKLHISQIYCQSTDFKCSWIPFHIDLSKQHCVDCLFQQPQIRYLYKKIQLSDYLYNILVVTPVFIIYMIYNHLKIIRFPECFNKLLVFQWIDNEPTIICWNLPFLRFSDL